MRKLAAFLLQSLAVLLSVLLAVPALGAGEVMSGVDCIDVSQPSLAELSLALREAERREAPGTSAAWAARDERRALLKSILQTRTPQADAVVTWENRFEGPRPFGQPSGVAINRFIRWNPIPSIQFDAPSFWHRFGQENIVVPVAEWYGLLKKDMTLYGMGVDHFGERLGHVYFEHDAIPKPVQVVGETLVAMDVTLLGNALVFGPNLILMPECVIRSPAYLGHGAARIAAGVSHRSLKEAALGLAEVAGAIATVAGAVGTMATVLEMADVMGGAPPTKTAAIHEYATASPYLDDPDSDESRKP